MRALYLVVLVLFFSCEESEESTIQPVLQEEDRVSDSVEKEIQHDGLQVRTILTPNSVRLGDPFELIITVEGVPDVEIEMPPFGEALGRLTIVDFTPKQTVTEKNGQAMQVHSQQYGLQANRSGEVVIPALRIAYRVNVESEWEEILTEQIPVNVISILPTDGDLFYQDTRQRLSPLPVEKPWVHWALGILLVCIVVGFGIRILFKREGSVHKLSPYQQTMLQLNQLQDEIATLAEQDSVDNVYAGLSIALRGYLEGQFKVSALEQTTEELRLSLEVDLVPFGSVVLLEHMAEILRVLSLCDGVKFAAQVRTLAEVQADWIAVQHLVNSIQKRSLEAVETIQTEEAQGGLVQT